jgi:succinyl-CoA synthetase beta subunit
MHLHEFHAKRWFADHGIPIPVGAVARSASEAREVAQQLGGQAWIVKAQVHAGGRGKAGGIQRVETLEEVEAVAARMLGTRLVTAQTGPAGLPVNIVLIEQPVSVQRELYLGAIIERSRERVVFMASQAGGMDIEQVAREHPEQILTATVEPIVGLMLYQCRQFAFGLGLNHHTQELTRIMSALYRLFIEKDASLVEINPLVVTTDGRLLALDAEFVLDDNALYRHPDTAELRDRSQEDETEAKAKELDLNYVSLAGNITCMVNGAGLAMATMDIIKLHGGEPANFLDVGGTATTGKGTAKAKVEALEAAGATVARSPADMGRHMQELLSR